MRQSCHARSLSGDIGELIGYLIPFAKPPYSPGLQPPATHIRGRRRLISC
jgi:hypothetical protein